MAIEKVGNAGDVKCGHAYRSMVFWGNMSIVESLNDKKLGMEVILNYLENMSSVIKERNLKNDQVYENITVLKLDIMQISGKKGR